MKKIRKRLLTLFLGTSCTIMASCSGDKSKTNKSNGALGNKDPETTPTRTPTGDQSTGDLPGETPNNPQKGGLPNTPGTSGKSGGGTTGGTPNSGGKGQQPQPFVLSQDVKEPIDNIKKGFPGFNIPADHQQKKQTIVDYLNSSKDFAEDEKINTENITTFIDLENGSSFCAIRKGVTMVDYQCDGFMDAGNNEGASGGDGGLAKAFNEKFGIDKINNALGGQTGFGFCKKIKIDWMNNDHTKDKDLFYAVGVQGANMDRLVELKENLFYITIDYLRNTNSNEGAHLSREQIKTTLENNFDGFEKQVNCNYQTIKLASDSATQKGKTADNPYYLGMNPISTSIWGFDKNAAAYINLAIMYYLTSITKECNNLCINMWCYANGEDTPYINAIKELKKK